MIQPIADGHGMAYEAMMGIVRKHDFSPDDVEEIACGMTSFILSFDHSRIKDHPIPKTQLEGRFSVAYTLVVSLLDRKAGPAQFTDEKVSAPQAQNLMRKVRIHVDPSLPEELLSTVVTVKLRDGREYSHRVDHEKGSIENPCSWEEVADKFRDFAPRSVISSERVEQVIELIERVESLENIGELMKVLIGQVIRALFRSGFATWLL